VISSLRQQQASVLAATAGAIAIEFQNTFAALAEKTSHLQAFSFVITSLVEIYRNKLRCGLTSCRSGCLTMKMTHIVVPRTAFEA